MCCYLKNKSWQKRPTVHFLNRKKSENRFKKQKYLFFNIIHTINYLSKIKKGHKSEWWKHCRRKASCVIWHAIIWLKRSIRRGTFMNATSPIRSTQSREGRSLKYCEPHDFCLFFIWNLQHILPADWWAII